MVDSVYLNGDIGDPNPNSGFNITVLTVRFDSINEKMSGVYKCNLSLSLTEPGLNYVQYMIKQIIKRFKLRQELL